MKTGIILSLFIAGASFPSDAASILTLRDSVDTQPIIYPESFETDVMKMRENWYLTTYAVIDENADSRPLAEVSDEEYIHRLSTLPVTIEMPFNPIVKSYIEMYTRRKRSLVENVLAMSHYYMPIFEEALDRNGVPLELKYLPIIESALNPTAVSKAGATGLWQFMIPTANGLGMEINSLVDERRDPYVSSDCAAKYLKQLHAMYDDWSLAIAAYNCGPGNINKALRRAGGGKKDFWDIYMYLPAETQGYVPAFIAANYVMHYYGKHNIAPALVRRPIVTDTVHVNKRVHFQQISDVLGVPMDAIRILNPQYRTDVIPGDIRPYALVLPSLQSYCYVANEDSIISHDSHLYARRTMVAANDGKTPREGSDARGRYIDRPVVKSHKVARGETLASIATKYGTTEEDIRAVNKLGNAKSVSRGKVLKINTYERTYLDGTPEAAGQSLDMAMTSEAPVEETAGKTESSAPQKTSAASQPAKTSAPAKTNSSKPKTTTYTVVSGDNLGRIAAKFHTTVKAIQAANGLKNDKIRAGQTLKIPTN